MFDRLRALLARPYGVVTGCVLCSGVMVGMMEDTRHWVIDQASAMLFPPGPEQEACLDSYFDAPRAKLPGSYLIVLTDLVNDTDLTQTRLVDRTLRRLYGVDPAGGIQLEAIPCAIFATSGNAAARVAAAETLARQTAERAGADVVIWGEVIQRDALIALSLTHATDSSASDFAVAQSSLDTGFADAIGALIAAKMLTLVALGPQDAGTFLVPRMEKVLSLTTPLVASPPPGMTEADLATLYRSHGDAHFFIGVQMMDLAHLTQSAKARRQVVALTPQARDPQGWADAQHDLGTALWAMADRGADSAVLSEAAEALAAAQTVRSLKDQPAAWAATQNSLANVLKTLGEREGDREALQKSVDAYRAILTVHTRESFPGDWAATQYNLGNVLVAFPEDDATQGRLTEAAAAYRASLEVRTAEEVPLDWADSQHNLALALARLGEMTDDTGLLDQALAGFQAALTVQTRDRSPFVWAGTQANLAATQLALGLRGEGTALLEQAVDSWGQVLEVLTVETAAFDNAILTGNRANALAALADRRQDAELAAAAVAGLQAAVTATRALGETGATDFFTARLAEAQALQSRLSP